jgi:hypothetical protein
MRCVWGRWVWIRAQQGVGVYIGRRRRSEVVQPLRLRPPRRRRGPEIYEHRSGSQDLNKRGDTATGPTRCSHSYLHLVLVRPGQGRVRPAPLRSACTASRLRLRVIRLRPLALTAGRGWARSPAPSPRSGAALPLLLRRPTRPLSLAFASHRSPPSHAS